MLELPGYDNWKLRTPEEDARYYDADEKCLNCGTIDYIDENGKCDSCRLVICPLCGEHEINSNTSYGVCDSCVLEYAHDQEITIAFARHIVDITGNKCSVVYEIAELTSKQLFSEKNQFFINEMYYVINSMLNAHYYGVRYDVPVFNSIDKPDVLKAIDSAFTEFCLEDTEEFVEWLKNFINKGIEDSEIGSLTNKTA